MESCLQGIGIKRSLNHSDCKLQCCLTDISLQAARLCRTFSGSPFDSRQQTAIKEADL